MRSYDRSDLNHQPMAPTRQITAKETINGVEHTVVLEQDRSGRYREVILSRDLRPNCGWVDPVVFLG
jgi:hypothetical protein